MLYSTRHEHVELKLDRLQAFVIVANNRLSVEFLKVLGTELVATCLGRLAKFLLNYPLEQRICVHQGFLSFRRITVFKFCLAYLDGIFGHCEN